MGILKKILRATAWTLGSILVFAGLYFGVAYACSRIALPAEKGQPREVAIYIMTNGAHTDLVVPVRTDLLDWSERIPYEHTASKDTSFNYLGLGWGDRGFFLDMPTWDDLTLRLAFNAAFWLNRTAMHATYHNTPEEGGSCRRIIISRDQYARMVKYIDSWFARDAAGHYINIPTDANYGPTDAFYEARGHYNLFFTCNTWTNSALHESGQRCCLWTIFDKGIFLKYKQLPLYEP